MGSGITSELGSGRKRKRDKRKISIDDIEMISSAFKPYNENVARKTEQSERNRARYEAADAKGRATQNNLIAIAQAKSMAEGARTESEERHLGSL